MKIEFDDKSYIEISKSISNKILITIAAKSQTDSLAIIANSVELEEEQFHKLIKLN